MIVPPGSIEVERRISRRKVSPASLGPSMVRRARLPWPSDFAAIIGTHSNSQPIIRITAPNARINPS